jgi:hypothetical protein
MKQNFSRRDFLTVAGVGLGALAFKPFNLESFYIPKRLPQFPDSEIIGRLVDQTDIRSRPNNDPLLNTAIGTLPADHLIPWEREVIGRCVLTNQKYLETRRDISGLRGFSPQRIYQTHRSQKYAGQPGFGRGDSSVC